MDGEESLVHEAHLFDLLRHERHIGELAPSAVIESNQMYMTPLDGISVLLFHSSGKGIFTERSKHVSQISSSSSTLATSMICESVYIYLFAD